MYMLSLDYKVSEFEVVTANINGLEVEKYPAPTRRIYDGPRNVGDCGSHLNRFCFT